MLERSPERLHPGVRKRDVDLGQNAIQTDREKGGVNRRVHVFHAGIGIEKRPACIHQMLARPASTWHVFDGSERSVTAHARSLRE